MKYFTAKYAVLISLQKNMKYFTANTYHVGIFTQKQLVMAMNFEGLRY